MSSPSQSALAGRHPIAVVAERTGLSQDLLRMWERRYAAVEPTRSAGGERLYSDADVERLRLLEAAVAAGRRIGQVARLSTAELAGLVEGDREAGPRRAAPPPEPSDARRELVDAAMHAVRAFDARALEDQLRRAAAVEGAMGFVSRVAAPLLRRIGDEWHGGRLSIAEEHFASAMIGDVVMDAMRAARPTTGAPALLVATPAGSRHIIAAAMAGTIAAAEGWNVHYLGGDLPTAEIAAAARAGRVQAVVLSVVYADDADTLGAELRALRATLPGDVRLIAGGRAVDSLTPSLVGAGIEVPGTLDDLRALLRIGA